MAEPSSTSFARSRAGRARAWRLAALGAATLAVPALAIAPLGDNAATPVIAPPVAGKVAAPARLHGAIASSDVQALVQWVMASGDNKRLPFLVVDKRHARVFVFGRSGELAGTAAALLGLGRGDDTVPGIGQRPLSAIAPAERTTPAGRFEAAIGRDLEQDVLWIDYDAALSLHRVIVGRPQDHRAARLASPSVLDNRISFGCINVPVAFFDHVVLPTFTATVGIVYILPEQKPLRAVFAMR